METSDGERDTGSPSTPRKRGPKAKRPDPSTCRIAELERENKTLKKKLRQAETIIDVQKKVSEILQIPLTENEEVNS